MASSPHPSASLFPLTSHVPPFRFRTRTLVSDVFHGLPRGIIFDCDGVVIDSREANITYYNYLREYIGLPKLTREQEDFVQAATVHQAMDAIFPKPLQPLLRDAAGKYPTSATSCPT